MTLSMQKYRIAAAAVLAVAASAFGQTTAKPAQPANQPTTAITTARETGSGMATGRREAASGQANGASPARNSGHATETVEYKDGEDMTTHYRPGNHKTATVQVGTGADATKKQVTLPACDGASKDAAKCAATQSASPSTHVNKVESISIKQ